MPGKYIKALRFYIFTTVRKDSFYRKQEASMEKEKLKHIRYRVEIRLTEQEKALLKKKAGKQDMSKYIRDILFEKQGNRKLIPPERLLALEECLRQLKKEVNHIGVNINQIVKNHNSKFYSSAEKRKLFALMEEVSQKMERIIEKINL